MDSCLADIFDSGNTPSAGGGSIGSPAYAGYILTEGGEVVRIIADLSAANTFSGVYTLTPGTPFAVAGFGTWSGTLSLEFSASGPGGPWLLSETRTTNFYDTLMYYTFPRWGRIGFRAGEYTNGTAHVMILQPPGDPIAIEAAGAVVGAILLEGST
jgi:hypothetical protein